MLDKHSCLYYLSIPWPTSYCGLEHQFRCACNVTLILRETNRSFRLKILADVEFYDFGCRSASLQVEGLLSTQDRACNCLLACYNSERGQSQAHTISSTTSTSRSEHAVRSLTRSMQAANSGENLAASTSRRRCRSTTRSSTRRTAALASMRL
jgi:hypothetical protein